jgi:enediyne biosynthesis protein E4
MNATKDPGATPVSPRKRKLRLTLTVLALAAIGATVLGVCVHLLNRPQQYAPGEESADVTSELSMRLPPGAPKPKFTDVTAESGLAGFRNFTGDRTSQLPEDTGPGLAWGDYNNDGDDDLFLVSAGGALNIPNEELLPCELHENLGGKFKKSDSFPELRIRGMGSAWGDYDNDGDLDLAVSGYNSLSLFENISASGQRQFRRVESFPNPPGFWTGIAWGDFDHDGDLDLYVCGYVRYRESQDDQLKGSDQFGTFVPYTLNPASYEPGLNMLLRNEGSGTFKDVAAELGVTNPTGRSLSALWHDFDDDGWQDLYVANDVSDNVFYRNIGGKFQDISHPAWVADYRSAMGLTAGDYDRDGDDDIFITHWVAQENALYENHWADFNRNTAQVKTNYPLRFTDVNEMRGLGQVSLPFVGWGTEFADLDADGWLDIVVANGSTIEEQNSNPKILKAQEAFLFWNNRGSSFHDLAPLNKSLSEKTVGRGLAVSDYDNDGDLDIAMAQLGRGVQLLRNDMQSGHWLELSLRAKPNHTADGTRVIVHAGGAQYRRTHSSASYLSQSSRTLHFGLGTNSVVDRVEVRWLRGETNVYERLAANERYELIEGDRMPRPLGIAVAQLSEKERLARFWEKQRAAMNAIKVEKNLRHAISLFREAILLNPKHEDSHYYLAQALAGTGELESALAELRKLQEINPQSHRAFQQWGNLQAQSAQNRDHLDQAERALETARQINPEETGVLLILGEVSLLKGDFALAQSRLTAACVTNPKASGGFFLRAYIALLEGDSAKAVELLKATRNALGQEWQPKGATAEGDVKTKLHAETSPLRPFYENWNGSEDPLKAFTSLDQHLSRGMAGK